MKGQVLTKLDLRKEYKHLYLASRKIEFVEVPNLNFIMVDGSGDPSGSAFQDVVGALYGLAYTLKFAMRNERATDYPVMVLEGLWWTDEGDFNLSARDEWNWTLMIMQPKAVTNPLFASALEELRRKKDIPALSRARLETFHEGLSAQVLHVGPYSAERSTVERLHDYVAQNGYLLRGKHHEIYLGDPRRASPAKLRTILRQPIEASPVR